MNVEIIFKCHDTIKSGTKNITVVEWESKCVRDLKYAIQDAIYAPVCDQRLYHRGQLLSDDSMPLLRTYHRQGEAFTVEFLAPADIPEISKHTRVLQEFSLCLQDELKGDTASDRACTAILAFRGGLTAAIMGLTNFLCDWKNVKTTAQRHYLVQENGIDILMEILRASTQLKMTGLTSPSSKPGCAQLDLPLQGHHILKEKLELQAACAMCFWAFEETCSEQRFLLQKGILPLVADGLLFDPSSIKLSNLSFSLHDYVQDIDMRLVGLLGGLVEADHGAQLTIARNAAVINKLISMIDRRPKTSNTYPLNASHLALHALCSCTFNATSTAHLVKCKVHQRIIDITKDLMSDKDGDLPLRYYSCMALARIHSEPQFNLDSQTSAKIDGLIERFLERHRPHEISEWEKKEGYFWMTLLPLVHIAFAGGWCHYHSNNSSYQGNNTDSHGSIGTYRGDQKACCCRGMESDIYLKRKLQGASGCQQGSHFMEHSDVDVQLENTLKRKGHCTLIDRKPARCPGSVLTQKFGIFILEHMLSLEDNRELLLSEGLLPHLVCLSWLLQGANQTQLKSALENFRICHPPNLKVIAQSVLAQTYGLEEVIDSSA